MKFRARLTAIVAMVLLVLGIGAAQFGPSASAASSGVSANTTSNNGCVVIRPAELAVCIPRL